MCLRKQEECTNYDCTSVREYSLRSYTSPQVMSLGQPTPTRGCNSQILDIKERQDVEQRRSGSYQHRESSGNHLDNRKDNLASGAFLNNFSVRFERLASSIHIESKTSTRRANREQQCRDETVLSGKTRKLKLNGIFYGRLLIVVAIGSLGYKSPALSTVLAHSQCIQKQKVMATTDTRL